MEGEEKIKFEAAEDILQEFLYLFQVFSHENGVHKECRKEIIELQITTSSLVDELNKPWNQDQLERRDAPKSDDENLVGDQAEADLLVPSKILKAGTQFKLEWA